MFFPIFPVFLKSFAARKTKFAKVMFSQVSVCPQWRCLCPRGVSGLCPGGSGGLSPGVSVQGGFCPGGSLQGVSVQGGLSRGSLSGGSLLGKPPSTVTSGQYASYWNKFLLNVVFCKLKTLIYFSKYTQTI